MESFTVYDLTAIPDDGEGWSVDSWSFKGDYKSYLNNEAILQMMKDEGFIAPYTDISHVHFVNESNGVIQLCDANDMRPLYNLFYEE
jgi:hypothetical protein